MALRFATNNFRTAMRRRNFASAAAASEKGFIEKFVPVEVRVLLFSYVVRSKNKIVRAVFFISLMFRKTKKSCSNYFAHILTFISS
jgi:hypothetical protein